jgi:hypothetical protein
MDRQQVKQAKAVLEDFKRQLVTIKAAMTDVESRIITMTNTLASVSSIPNEILATIFKEVCASDGYSGDGTDAPRSDLPSMVLVSHINRRFRHVAIDTPSLWARVHIHLSSTVDIHLMDAYFERSKSNVLRIWIIGVTHQLDSVHKVVGRLLPHTGRWKTLSVLSDTETIMRQIVLSLQYLCVPQLESIHIQLKVLPLGTTGTQVRIFQGGAPALKSVVLRNINLLGCFPPLSAVETLHNSTTRPHQMALSHSQFRDILIGAQSLTNLQLSTAAFDPDIGTDLEAIDLPSLRTLVLIVDRYPFQMEGNSLIRVFKTLRIPSLQTLKLHAVAPVCAPDIVQFLQAEGHLRYPSLQSLAFADTNCSEYFPLDLARALPNITSLSLTRSTEDFVLKLLMNRDDIISPSLWPHLKTLELVNKDIDLDLLRNFLRSREGNIHSLTLSMVGAIPLDFDDWLKAHVKYVDIATQYAFRTLQPSFHRLI